MIHGIFDDLVADNILRLSLAKTGFDVHALAELVVAQLLRACPVRRGCTPSFPKYRETMDYMMLSSRLLATSSAE